MIIEKMAYARAGLVGNPSDGYFGKTISIIVRNFMAKVGLYESPELEIIPSFKDRSRFSSVHDLADDVVHQGYYGGVRLLKATIKKFVEYCDEQGIKLDEKNFTIRYRSTIPRRVGLAGSSALVTATLRCLMEYYDVAISKPMQANLILSVENDELGISAGLQDRVIQVYEGLVYMDFARELIESRGYGEYEQLDIDSLPNLFIAYRTDKTEGSEVFHNNVRERWNRGEQQVVDTLEGCAECAQEARDLIVAGKGDEIGPLLNRNFELRRSMYNLDPRNTRLVETAQHFGCGCKYSGSGGTVVGTYDSEKTFEMLRSAYLGMDAKIIRPQIAPIEHM
jgi:glucuronokinase